MSFSVSNQSINQSVYVYFSNIISFHSDWFCPSIQ